MSLAVLSPYHLTTREPPAMVALSLADEVTTYLPTLGEQSDRDEAERIARDEPAYLDMIESWQWSRQLWGAGLLTMGAEGRTAHPEIQRVLRQIRDDDQFAPLRPLLPASALDEDRVMRNVARDVLRGGPDPAISVPVAAGLDRLAVQRSGYAMRSGATSVAQRAEAAMGSRLFALALPMLIQASAGRIDRLRQCLHAERQQLALMLEAVAQDVAAGVTPADGTAWRDAAEAWTERFNDHRDSLTEPCEDEDELHVIESVVAIEGVLLPIDAVLRSSMAALRSVSHPRAVAAPGGRSTAVVQPVVRDPLSDTRVFTLVCRVIGRPTHRGGA